MTPTDTPATGAIARAAAENTAAGSGAAPRGPAPGWAHGLILVFERLGRAARSGASAIASRRGMALTLAGGFVVALAWIGERDSAWGFPMLIAGAAMIGLGLLGPRLSGSLALRWGEDGAYFQLTSTVAPPGQRRSSPRLQDPVAAAEDDEKSLIPPSEIEGEAETIDFKVTAGADEPAAEPSASTD